MENSLLVGLSRQMALSHELDIVANNIANIDTTGFKADNASFQEFLQTGARNGDFQGNDKRVSFVLDRATWTDMSPGALQRTGDPLDLAIDGKGFFVAQTPQGQQRYTRNGSFSINATGQLVTMNGDQVIGAAGPITFQTGDHDINISSTGIITVRDSTGAESPRGQLQIANFDQPQRLQKDAGSMFAAPADVNPGPQPANTRVVQGALEKSNVQPITMMTRMIEITRSYSDIAAILSQQDSQRRSALQQLSQAPSSS